VQREKDHANLLLMHPELRTVWADLDNRPRIKPREDPQPAGLSLELLPFQKEGLHWMRLQEKSEWRGGILADEMGMGKTIQTLSLIMTDPNAGPNLVVAPTVAIMQWKSEIEKYTGDALKVYVFHGTNKSDDWEELSKYNVILTSYNLLESIYRKEVTGHKRKDGLAKEDSALHKIEYHRVILDEAHNIKQRNSKTTKAVCALKTKYKLCLTGTPLQNRIGEVFSLLRFLEVGPFAYNFCRKCPCKTLHWKFSDNRHCDKCGHGPMQHICFFNYEFLKPIQSHGNEGEGQAAHARLQKLLHQHVMLRRTKREREEDLGLPPKVMTIRRDNFSEEELDLYNSIYSDAQRKFDTFVAQGVLLNNYANIFTLITRMRQIADHPDLFLRKEATEGQNIIVCHVCDDEAEDPIKAKCHHTFCRDCAQRYFEGYDGTGEPDCPKCHVPLLLDLTQPAIETVDAKKGSIINRIDMSKWRSSTKIEALCEELHKLRKPNQSTKSIVFSQFTSMLQLIEWRLNRAGFKCVMLEGSMTPAQREATINHFMQNADVDVFLVSLRAGGVALNLIEASQVFLMEPWWNPSVEWQVCCPLPISPSSPADGNRPRIVSTESDRRGFARLPVWSSRTALRVELSSCRRKRRT
jgi:DNA repair protein RAD16